MEKSSLAATIVNWPRGRNYMGFLDKVMLQNMLRIRIQNHVLYGGFECPNKACRTTWKLETLPDMSMKYV